MVRSVGLVTNSMGTKPVNIQPEPSPVKKNKGVIVYAIGVGSGVDQAELEEIASGLDYVFTSSSFESLQNEASKIRKSVCEVSKSGK